MSRTFEGRPGNSRSPGPTVPGDVAREYPASSRRERRPWTSPAGSGRPSRFRSTRRRNPTFSVRLRPGTRRAGVEFAGLGEAVGHYGRGASLPGRICRFAKPREGPGADVPNEADISCCWPSDATLILYPDGCDVRSDAIPFSRRRSISRLARPRGTDPSVGKNHVPPDVRRRSEAEAPSSPPLDPAACAGRRYHLNRFLGDGSKELGPTPSGDSGPPFDDAARPSARPSLCIGQMTQMEQRKGAADAMQEFLPRSIPVGPTSIGPARSGIAAAMTATGCRRCSANRRPRPRLSVVVDGGAPFNEKRVRRSCAIIRYTFGDKYG